MLINDYQHFILTLGYGRSGSTLFGNVLNNHSNCYCGIEFRFLEKLQQNKRNQENIVNQLLNECKISFKNGSQKLKYNQKDYVEYNINNNKDKILCIGDKKSAGNTTILIKNPKFFNNLLINNPNIRIFINMRNPFNVLKSIKSSQFYNTNSAHIKCNKNTPDIDIFKDILYYQNHSLNFYKDHKDICFILYYDDIINCTKNTLTNIFNFLNIHSDLSLCKIINNNKIESNIIPHEYLETFNKYIDNHNLIYFDRYLSNN
jgi:hypothetical protein